jgi:hypothetical protein
VSEHAYAYIQAVNQAKEISGTYGMKVLCECVEIVRRRGLSLTYSSGNYETDTSLARIDGSILNNRQEHPSVANHEKLLAAKPERALQGDSDRQSSSTSSLCLAHYRQALT